MTLEELHDAAVEAAMEAIMGEDGDQSLYLTEDKVSEGLLAALPFLQQMLDYEAAAEMEGLRCKVIVSRHGNAPNRS
jgi:hypothetical protein